ncbi:MAG: extracellular solute-binding protein [bacterium]
MRRFLIISVIVLIPAIAVILIISGAINKPQPVVDPVKLVYWTIEDEADNFKEAIAAYRRSHPYINIEVVTKRSENYYDSLVEAWAKGAGPDIFSIPNTDIGTYADFIEPLPETTSVYYYQLKTVLFQKQLSITKQVNQSVTTARLGNDFIDAVGQDVIRGGDIYGLPLSTDSLAIYYNRDILNNSEIVSPATTWQELVAQIPKLTILDNQSQIIQSGIALGLADNVDHSSQILSLLMMQNGTMMTDVSNRIVIFDRSTDDYSPGLRAIEFYTGFAAPTKETYTWSDKFSNSVDNFIEGKVAYLIGTKADGDRIAERETALRYSLVPMFHINPDGTDTNAQTSTRSKINAATYMVETVAKRSKHTDEAWHFLQYLSRDDIVASYLNSTGKVSALRTMLAQQVKSPDLEVFANQALTAKNWYFGEDWLQVDDYFSGLINAIIDQSATPLEALRQTAKQVQLTYSKS